MTYRDKSNDPLEYYKGVAKDEFKPRNDLRGLRFGRLVVCDFDHKGGTNGRTYYYKCKCDCGNEIIKSSTYLLNDNLYPHQSCGCWHRELNIAASTTHRHGNKKNKTYKTWVEMKLRCLNPNNHAFSDYGGRGIKICEEWMAFENFLADMGERPDNMTLDRIDVNGNYEPSNCRWATMKEQCNNRRSNFNITHQGRTQTLTQWCEELGLNYPNAQYHCIKHGKTLEEYLKFRKNKRK